MDDSVWVWLLWVWFAAWALALTRVDLREHRLPNQMVAIALAGCVLITVFRFAASGNATVVVGAALGSVVAVAFFAAAHYVGGVGMGDVKYAAVTGWMLGTIGWSAVWWGHFAGFVLAGCVVLVGWLVRAWNRRTAVPFGPFMGLGAIAVGGLGALGGLT